MTTLQSLSHLSVLLILVYKTDNRADDLTKDGMLKGIEQAAAFLLFLR